jgi:hypothetical protein
VTQRDARSHIPVGYEIASIRKGGAAVSLGQVASGMRNAFGGSIDTVGRYACSSDRKFMYIQGTWTQQCGVVMDKRQVLTRAGGCLFAASMRAKVLFPVTRL